MGMTQIIADIASANYFEAQTLFLKQSNNKFGNTIVVSIHSICQNKHYELVTKNGHNFIIYEIDKNYCIQLMLQKNVLFAALFGSTICLKDDLELSRDIHLAVKPILTMHNIDDAVSLGTAWNTSAYKTKNASKEISIRFCDIESDVDFYYNVLIPFLSSLSNITHKSHSLLQFEKHHEIGDAIYTIYLGKDDSYRELLTNAQTFLYMHSPELKLRNIRIPYDRVISNTEQKSHALMVKIADFVTEFQSSVLANNDRESILSSQIVTEMTYLYIVMAKTFYQSYNRFEAVNKRIYRYFINLSASNTVKFLLTNNIITKLETKIEAEHRNLSLLNIERLYSNYKLLIENWKVLPDNHNDLQAILKDIKQYIIQGKPLMWKDSFFLEMTKSLFASFSVNDYYKAYIPYILIFLNDEI